MFIVIINAPDLGGDRICPQPFDTFRAAEDKALEISKVQKRMARIVQIPDVAEIFAENER